MKLNIDIEGKVLIVLDLQLRTKWVQTSVELLILAFKLTLAVTVEAHLSLSAIG